jgi:hypothetical protein
MWWYTDPMGLVRANRELTHGNPSWGVVDGSAMASDGEEIRREVKISSKTKNSASSLFLWSLHRHLLVLIPPGIPFISHRKRNEKMY